MGVNYLSETFTPGEQQPRTEATAYYLGTKRMNVVRFGIKWEMLQPKLNGSLDSTYVSHIDTLIADATTYGGRVIIELHNYGRRTISATDYIIGETGTVTSAHFSDAWTRIANQWKANANVIFGLMNEPHDQVAATLVSVSNAAIAAIRATGATQLILVCPNQWNTYGWRDDTYGNLTQMLNIVDTGHNFMFDVHHYFDAFSAGSSSTVVPEAAWKEGLDVLTSWLRTNGKKAICGEFATPDNEAGNTALTTFLAYMQTNNDVWKGWCHLGGGGWWQQNFIFRLDPYASEFDKDNPDRNTALGGTGKATRWDAPLVDRPPMAILQRYLPPGGTTFSR